MPFTITDILFVAATPLLALLLTLLTPNPPPHITIIIASTPALLLLRVLPSVSNLSSPSHPAAPAQTIFNDNKNSPRPVGSWHCLDVYGHMQFQLITDGPGFVVAKKSNPEIKVDVWHGVAYPRMVSFDKCVWVLEDAGEGMGTKE